MIEPLDLEEILPRIKQLIRDLETIRDRTSSQLFSPEQRVLQQEFLAAPGSMEIIRQFKQVLDDLRRIMWLHMEVAVASSVSESETGHKLLQRAAEILCALSVRRPQAKLRFKAVTASYLDRVMELVDSRMETKKTGN